jgi:hypothetical protein
MAVGVLGFLGAVAATVVLTANSNKKETVADIAVGDCFNGDANDVDTVDCTEPHQFELFHVAAVPDPSAAFPGADQALTDGGNACTLALVDYYGAPPETAVANGLEILPIAPTEAQWDDGDTDTYCLAGLANGDAVDESIEGKGAA